MFLIDDTTGSDILFPAGMGRGLVPRDYAIDPIEMFAPPSEIPLIPESEYDARIEEQERTQSSLEHIRLRGNYGHIIPSLNQGSMGFCWDHSVVHTAMLSRAAANQPYIPLSAYAAPCILMNYQDKGAWCGLGAKFARERGIPSQVYWPQGSMDRRNDSQETWDNAAKHKITSDWVDLTRPVWGQNLTFQQVATCLLSNIPCALDYNFWGHSIAGLRLVKVEPGSYGIKFWNSWGDNWGDKGMGVLRGSRAVPDGAIATRNTTAS